MLGVNIGSIVKRRSGVLLKQDGKWANIFPESLPSGRILKKTQIYTSSYCEYLVDFGDKRGFYFINSSDLFAVDREIFCILGSKKVDITKGSVL